MKTIGFQCLRTLSNLHQILAKNYVKLKLLLFYSESIRNFRNGLRLKFWICRLSLTKPRLPLNNSFLAEYLSFHYFSQQCCIIHSYCGILRIVPLRLFIVVITSRSLNRNSALSLRPWLVVMLTWSWPRNVRSGELSPAKPSIIDSICVSSWQFELRGLRVLCWPRFIVTANSCTACCAAVNLLASPCASSVCLIKVWKQCYITFNKKYWNMKYV